MPQLKDIMTHEVGDGDRLKIMTSYFTLYAFKEIKNELLKLEGVDLIINPNKYDSSNKIIETVEENSLKINLDYCGIAKDFASWIEAKVNIRKIKSRKIDGKMLSITSASTYKDYITHADFNAIGLGILDNAGRVHINEKIENPEKASALRQAFELIWNNPNQVEDIKSHILSDLKKIYQDKSPELLYYFTLNQLFHNFLEDADAEAMLEKRTGITETMIWNKLYDFQRDGVVGAINKIEK